MALNKGAKAPEFKLPSTSDENFVLRDNVPCIIYFYPKDFTPGCTEEACSFRDGFAELRGLDVAVFGISRDSISQHKKFKSAHNLPFELLSDANGNVCKAYDALIPVVKIPKRVTYLIDKELRIKAVYSDLFGAKKHLERMISELKVE
ncbi:peroxiredoxin [Roseivirga misakiensis]|uniref:thioredoxin-dependent peroxiredoxin n=1 Tax=Roseivirga misakiensis TaxID=1563681 RepID=A0A1E5T1D8_9BACT|nr:peroxiredoxin [Roseivirga misakiensis]OEK05192.1 peroxiredoxin [Roseivirga misakiensis]